jgi:integrase
MAAREQRRCNNVSTDRRVLLTARNVPTLPADGGETLWRDRSLPGFYLAVHPPTPRFPQGVRTFGVWYRVRGRARQKRLGRHPVVTLASARERAREILESARLRGIDLVGAPGAGTLAQLVASFIEAARKERPRTRTDSTLDGYAQMLEADIRKARAGSLALSELRRRDLTGMLRTIAGRAPVVARRVHQLVRTACRWAVGEELIAADPTAGLPRPGSSVSRERVLRDEEIAILWRACEEESSASTSAATERGRGRKGGKWTRERSEDEMAAAAQRSVLARVLLLTAQRSGETAMMAWSEIDRDSRLWNIPPEHRKGQRGKRSGHVVPLSEAAKEELRLWSLHPLAKGARVFPWALANHRHWIEPLRGRAEKLGLVEHWTPHDLRRTAASGMARLGTSRSTIAMILGHTMQEGGAVTGVYDRFDRMPERAAALEAWGKHVAAITAGGQ